MASAEPPRAALRDRLAGRLDGLFVKLAALETLEIAAHRFDFCVIDLEHSLLGESEALRLLQHARALDFAALVRIPVVDPGLINRALEAGAAGIHLAGVTSPDQIRAAGRAMTFPPRGERSASTAHGGARYGAVSLRDYVDQAARPVLVAAFESPAADAPVAEILGAGADVAFVGLSDLRVACGFDEALVATRVDEVAMAAATAGVAFGGFGLTHPGASFHVSTSDIALFAAGAEVVAGRRTPRPAARPVVTTWPEIPDEPVRAGIRRRGFGNDDALLVLNACEPGMELRPHSHAFDQIALILGGSGHYWVDGVRHPVGPDSVLLIPAGAEHFIEPGEETMLNLDLFAPLRPDYAHLLDWMTMPPTDSEGATT